MDWRFITLRTWKWHGNCIKLNLLKTDNRNWLYVHGSSFELWPHTGLPEWACSVLYCALPCGRQELRDLRHIWKITIVCPGQGTILVGNYKPCPRQWAMECLSWIFWRKITMIYQCSTVLRKTVFILKQDPAYLSICCCCARCTAAWVSFSCCSCISRAFFSAALSIIMLCCWKIWRRRSTAACRRMDSLTH